jgi:hypothetical protein
LFQLYLAAGNPFTRSVSGDLLAARELKISQRPFELPILLSFLKSARV